MTSPTFQPELSVPLGPLTTLQAGGCAERYIKVRTAGELAAVATRAQSEGVHVTVLGSGSNVLPSDAGVRGLIVHNAATRIEVGADGEIEAETGCSFQELFLKTSQRSLSGLEFAVGIPGTLGGALVSNAGAYRSNVSEFLTELQVSTQGATNWVKPTWMEFDYRNSILRRPDPPQAVLIKVRFLVPRGVPKAIYDEAREYQRQRISKQPPQASAGSFFKNINSQGLADSLEGLPERLRIAGVVPAGYLIQHVGLAGFDHRGAKFSERHANYIVNARNASSTSIRELAQMAKKLVLDRFGVVLEEEVLYLGDWRAFEDGLNRSRGI